MKFAKTLSLALCTSALLFFGACNDGLSTKGQLLTCTANAAGGLDCEPASGAPEPGQCQDIDEDGDGEAHDAGDDHDSDGVSNADDSDDDNDGVDDDLDSDDDGDGIPDDLDCDHRDGQDDDDSNDDHGGT